MSRRNQRLSALVASAAGALVLSGCSFSPYELPLPGGADVGDDPYTVTVEFRDVLDLVPQSAVRVDDIAVGKVTKIRLNGWTATATLQINDEVELPDNAEATIRQTSLLGEKFVALAPPAERGTGRLGDGDAIPLQRTGRNPEVEEVLGAASLLLNGGGLERTNTIVRELNAALDGNEPEVKELLTSSEIFIGQLDENKGQLLTALEKVDRLARTTQDQEAAITGALDDLPEALRVLDAQRDDLVGLLDSLEGLSDSATDLIRRSKDDTLAVLRDLEPTLRELANAGDDLASASELILTFPFTDAIAGGSVSRAMASCSAIADDDAIAEDAANGACYGDYANLDINVTVSLEQGVSLVQGLLSIVGGVLGSQEPLPGAEGPDLTGEGDADSPASRLVELVEGLVPADAGGTEPGADTTPSAPSPQGGSGGSGSQEGGGQSSPSGSGGIPGICTLLQQCRSATSAGDLMAQQDDVGRLVLGPVVAR